ncbi:hypothetical protein ACQP2Y_21195 [Actinoplanes sp. CA-051413]|uniref:hypothetical protein n=1 Tax=Actinoplanes sp. CA-051413 TaxID=3239899 RepID=UPI003D96C691
MCPRSFLRPSHLICLRYVAERRATVSARGFMVDGRFLGGVLRTAMSGLWLDALVCGPSEVAEPGLLWLTDAGVQALASAGQEVQR